MKNRKLHIIGILVFLTFSFTNLFAQDKILKNRNFSKVIGLVEEKRYFLAIKELDDYSKKFANNFYYNFYRGICELNLNTHRNLSIGFFKKALAEIEPQKVPHINYISTTFNLAKAYFYAEKIDSAQELFNRLFTIIPAKYGEMRKQTVQFVSYCLRAKELISRPIKAKVMNISALNTIFNEHSPLVTADESSVVFTSTRAGSTGGKFSPEGDFYEDIYIAEKNKGKWMPPRRISDNINTDYHESDVWLSIDGSELYIYKGIKNTGDIYFSKLRNDGIWTIPKPLKIINSEAYETSAFKTMDGKYLFFSSNRKGGYGGKDLYFITRLEDGSWSKAKNLGPTINSSGDEDCPYLQPNGSFYFSSTGHKSMGGFDIFVSHWKKDDSFSIPRNIGYPVNSVEDDLFFIPSLDGLRAYLSSARKGGKGKFDLYKVSFANTYKTEINLLNGVVKAESGKLSNVNILVIQDSFRFSFKPNIFSGNFLLPLKNLEPYKVIFSSQGNQSVIKNINFEKKIENSFFQYFNLDTIFLQVPIIDVSNLPLVTEDTLLAMPAPSLDDIDIEEEDYSWADSSIRNANQTPIVNVFFDYNPQTHKQNNYKTQINKINYIPVAPKRYSIPGFLTIEDIPFGFNQVKISNTQTLSELSSYLKKNKKAKILLTGYTDSKGDSIYNLKLSIKRVQEVYNALLAMGVSPKQLVLQSKGEDNLIFKDWDKQDRQASKAAAFNRRVEIKILQEGKNGILMIKPLDFPKELTNLLIRKVKAPPKKAIKDTNCLYYIELIASSVPLELPHKIAQFEVKRVKNKFGVYSYNIGNIKTKKEAIYWLRELKSRGFVSAKIIVVSPVDDKLGYFYSIHIMMTDKPLVDFDFSKLGKVIAHKSENYYHYYYGQYLNLVDAEQARIKALKAGFKNAFIFINDYKDVEQ